MGRTAQPSRKMLLPPLLLLPRRPPLPLPTRPNQRLSLRTKEWILCTWPAEPTELACARVCSCACSCVCGLGLISSNSIGLPMPDRTVSDALAPPSSVYTPRFFWVDPCDTIPIHDTSSPISRHPAYFTNQYWYDKVNQSAVTAPAWKPLSELHPCDYQASMLKGCIPLASVNPPS